jgi:hypothetical protein
MSSERTNIKAHCNNCGGNKNHLILFDHHHEWHEDLHDDPPTWINGKDSYELLQCAGCDHIVFRHTSWFSEYTDDEGRPIPTIAYCPPATFRRHPKWLSDTSNIFRFFGPQEFVPRLINEIYTALHSDCRAIVAMGIRALLEQMLVDKVGDNGSFTSNLKKFEMEGFIASKEREVIETTLEVGHASIHRNYNPSKDDLIRTLDITENLMERIYIFPSHATTLQKRIPPKKSR